MATQLITDVQCTISKGVQSSILVSLLPIYPQKADLLGIPDIPPNWIVANAMYLYERGLILLDTNTDLSDPVEVVGRLTADGVDKAISIIRNIVARQSAPRTQHSSPEEEPETVYLLTAYGEQSQKQSEG